MSTFGPTDDQLRLLLESISDYAIYMLDPEGRVQSWNPAAERIKGYSFSEVQGQPFHRFFTPEDRRAGLPNRILERARAEGRVESEGWRLRRDGSRFWAMATVQAMRDDSGELVGFAKVTRDMTEQRAAQLAVIENERRFRFLVEGVVDYAIYMLDVNGMVSNWNRGAERIKGYAADDVVGRHFSMFYTPEDRQAGMPGRALERALAEGRFEAEGWRVRKDGQRFWASVVIDPIQDDDGRHIGFAKITRDASARKAAEEALAHSERQFRLLVSGVVDYALYMLDPNGVVSNWNTGAQAIKGYSAEEAVGQHFSIFYTEADRASGLPRRALQTAETEGRFEAEGWRVRKDGRPFWASVVIDAIRDDDGVLQGHAKSKRVIPWRRTQNQGKQQDDDGVLVGFAKITRDITERRTAQLELQQAHDRLAQAQKMEAIGQLTGGVAHDFNNLLMVVSGQAEILRGRVGDDPRVARSIDAIDASARRGQGLTRHLLSFARRQRLKPAPLHLGDQAESIGEILHASLGSSVTLDLRLGKELWPVHVDASELELALLNLAVNARDAMPGGGRLTVTAENRSLKKDASGLQGDFVALRVSDSGQGMPADIQARVFEPFFTTKDVDKGTGLGLSQVYGFVEQSGGRVVLDSELGKGTTFILYLPRSRGEAVAAEARDRTGPAAAPRGLDILLVEDNPEVCDVACALLEQLGNTPRVATSARAALAVLAEGPAPDVLFSDIVMAGEMNGLELARAVRSGSPDLPILLATGYSEALGGTEEFPVITKPYSLEELGRALAALPHRTRIEAAAG